MKAQSTKTSSVVKEAAPDSEEQKFKQKCKELKKRILEVEENNEVATLALYRTRNYIRRLRLEYSILLERLESRAIVFPDGNVDQEELSPPPSPSILDESLNITSAKVVRNGLSKKSKKVKGGSDLGGNGLGTSKSSRIRDPDLPKRPTNAYLIFCDMEKERIKHELEEKNLGVSGDLSKTLTEAWKNLGDEDRKPYYKLYEDDRQRYQREMSIYNQRKSSNADEEYTQETKSNKKQKIEAKNTEEEETPEASEEIIQNRLGENDGIKSTEEVAPSTTTTTAVDNANESELESKLDSEN